MNATRLYFLGLALLATVALFGTTVRGTTGWIGLGSFHFQPVELIKLIMAIFLAGFLSKKKSEFGLVVRVAASVILVSVPIFLILLQPDFGSAAIIVGGWIVMLVASDSNKKHLLALGLIVLVLAGGSWHFLKVYQKERIVALMQPELDPQGSGYNVIQSMVAVGSGGVLGKGIGHGSQSRLNFLPEKHTDFIFAVIAEELGLIGSLAIVALFGLLLFRLKEIARTARDNLGRLLVIGIMATFFLQIFVNIGMNIGLVPVTGVPLPLVSYGGSSLVVMLASIGVAENVYLRRSG
jgi:rod shape determining protein RodA